MEEEFLEVIGRRIAHLRKERGWTQVELSKKLDIKRSSLARIEVGKINSSLLSIKKIADSFGLTISELLKIDEV